MSSGNGVALRANNFNVPLRKRREEKRHACCISALEVIEPQNLAWCHLVDVVYANKHVFESS